MTIPSEDSFELTQELVNKILADDGTLEHQTTDEERTYDIEDGIKISVRSQPNDAGEDGFIIREEYRNGKTIIIPDNLDLRGNNLNIHGEGDVKIGHDILNIHRVLTSIGNIETHSDVDTALYTSSPKIKGKQAILTVGDNVSIEIAHGFRRIDSQGNEGCNITEHAPPRGNAAIVAGKMKIDHLLYHTYVPRAHAVILVGTGAEIAKFDPATRHREDQGLNQEIYIQNGGRVKSLTGKARIFHEPEAGLPASVPEGTEITESANVIQELRRRHSQVPRQTDIEEQGLQ